MSTPRYTTSFTVASTPAEVFAAVTAPRAWWSADITGPTDQLGQDFHFDAGDSIHTENSHKFSIDGFRTLAIAAGWRPGPAWVDKDRLFSVHWLHAPDAHRSP